MRTIQLKEQRLRSDRRAASSAMAVVGAVLGIVIAVFVATSLAGPIAGQYATLEADTTNFSASEITLIGLGPLFLAIGVGLLTVGFAINAIRGGKG